MLQWTPQRGVLLYRQRLGAGTRPLTMDEPQFPWLAVPLFGLGFTLFFAGLALIGIEWRLWEAALAAAGLALMAAGFGVLARRFL